MPQYPETSTTPAGRRHDAIKSGEKAIDLTVRPTASQESSGDRSVLSAWREILDTPLGFPFSEATPKIALDTRRRLISLLYGFREQLHRDCRDSRRDVP